MPSSYSLGSRFESLIRELVNGGRYNNASEVIRDGLRMVETRERGNAFAGQGRSGQSAEARDVVLEPERRADVLQTIERIKAFRKTMPRLTIEEITSARHEGHRY